MSEFNTGTRRGTLQNIRALFEDTALLEKIAGTDVEVDCALALFAMNNPELSATLSQYLDVDELIADVKHIDQDMVLRKARRFKET